MTTTEEKLDLFERPKNLSKEFKIFTLNNNLTIEQITSTFININDEWSISNNLEGPTMLTGTSGDILTSIQTDVDVLKNKQFYTINSQLVKTINETLSKMITDKQKADVIKLFIIVEPTGQHVLKLYKFSKVPDNKWPIIGLLIKKKEKHEKRSKEQLFKVVTCRMTIYSTNFWIPRSMISQKLSKIRRFSTTTIQKKKGPYHSVPTHDTDKTFPIPSRHPALNISSYITLLEHFMALNHIMV